jgi:hypothetical protein
MARGISLTLALFLVSPFFLFVVRLHFNINGQWTLRLTGEGHVSSGSAATSRSRSPSPR